MGGWGSIANNTSYALRMQSELLARLQEQAASGTRIIRASDGPSDAYRILNLRSQSESITSYLKNIEDVSRTLNTGSDVLSAMVDNLARVRQLITQSASGTYRPEQRVPVANEISSLLDQLLSLANTQSLGRYIFGGSTVSRPPYEAIRVGDHVVGVSYQGSLNNLPVPVAPGIEYSGLVVGDQTFRSNERSAPEFLGNTGASAGTMTSSVRGDVWLTVIHDMTSYPPMLGLSAGASSFEGDTILGLHTVVVDAASQTVQLDDGQPVHFELGETNLLVTNAAGDRVYVNLSGWTGASGAAAVNASGWMTIDDGASWTPVDFTENQALTDSRTGGILYVNTAAMQRTGTEPVRVGGTYDMFSLLMGLRDLLLNKRQLPEAEQTRLLGESVGAVLEVSAMLTRQLTTVGSRLGALENLKNSLQAMKNSSDDHAAMLQDADIVQVATKLARTQTLYEMTLASSSKLLRLSLLDFI